MILSKIIKKLLSANFRENLRTRFGICELSNDQKAARFIKIYGRRKGNFAIEEALCGDYANCHRKITET
jgi:hypothetical protein